MKQKDMQQGIYVSPNNVRPNRDRVNKKVLKNFLVIVKRTEETAVVVIKATSSTEALILLTKNYNDILSTQTYIIKDSDKEDILIYKKLEL